jgi:regulator of PEP synthase PpsR (kinase-PPPase family)
MKPRIVFCLSDHTGITAQAVAASVVSQFPELEFRLHPLPFLDSVEKARAAVAIIAGIPDALVFSTLTDPALRAVFHAHGVTLLDVFERMNPALEAVLGQLATPRGGRTHGMAADYEERMDAVNYSLATDDGLAPERLGQAELILLGVSRVGKTPTALYLALQYGYRVANYPLTPDDLDAAQLPPCLIKQHGKLRGLTVSADRLAHLREARYPGSHYASRAQCASELAAALALFKLHAIPTLDSTAMSVEEIAAHLRHASPRA